MSFSISESIRGDQVLGPRVLRANQLLGEVIGPTAESVNVKWDLAKDARDRPVVHLVLSDFTKARVEAQFAPDELTNEGHLYDRFYKIWGDLLQRRSHQQLDQLSGKIDVSGQ